MTAFPSFSEFFQACTDHRPYPWQTSLWEQVRDHGWPDAVDVPTGLGKTAALLAGVYELARQVHGRLPRTAPQRIIHVVDRKIVVDQTAALLSEVADRIDAGRGPLAPVRAAMCRLAGPWADQPLVVARIHGEAPDRRTWLRPTGAVIVTMTAHQVVSRLLFRGLGVSERTRSLHAGLLGVDSVIVMDEPHLAHQAVQTIRDVLRLQSSDPLGLPPTRMTLLGASTPPQMHTGGRVVGLSDDDLSDEHARQRIQAPRSGQLVETAMKDKAVVQQIVSLVQKERAHSAERRIGVIVNSVGLAQQVFAMLKEPADHKALITSRFRPIDREATHLGRRTIVATQTVEVGVDISFDVLITEEAAWPALQQRVGRLNRAADAVDPVAHVLVGVEDSAPRAASAAVYGKETVLATRRHLRERAQDGVVDLSLAAQLQQSAPEEVWPPAPRTATFHQGFLPTMTTTFPTPFSDLPVDAFIAGPEVGQPLDVLVCWREDPFLAVDVPPLPQEQVSVPLPALRAFLAQQKPVDVADVDITMDDGKTARLSPSHPAAVVLRHGELQPRAALARLHPGDEVVLSPEWGGYRNDLGWAPHSSDPVDDVQLSVFAHGSGRRRGVAVLSEATLRSWARRANGHDADTLSELLEILRSPEAILDEVSARLPELVARLGLEGTVSVTDQPGGVSAAAKGPVVLLQQRPAWAEGSKGHSATVTLQAHQVQVQDTVAAVCDAISLDEQTSRQASLSGRWHDQGKEHTSFQAYLGNPDSSQPWAKSRAGAGNRAADRGQARSVGHPPGWRHEGLSAQWCREAGMDDLTVHLVASHHGRARPLLLSAAEGPGQQENPAGPEAFDRLNSEFGPWGLAYLEAVVRLSDWLASERPLPETAETAPEPRPRLTASAAGDGGAAPAEAMLEGVSSSPLTGWYAIAGLLRVASDHGAQARVRWSGSDGALGLPIWSGDVAIDEAARLVIHSGQWALMDAIGETLGESGLHAKHEKAEQIAAVRPALYAAEQGNAWSVLAALEDWMPNLDGKAELTLPTFHNNSNYIARAAAARKKDADGSRLSAALTDPLEGWDKGGSSGGMDHPRGDVGVTGWESMQDIRPSRSALAPAAVLGMLSLGSAGELGVGPDTAGRRLLLPLPQEPVTWAQLAALARGARFHHGWVLSGEAVAPSTYAKGWATRPEFNTARHG